MKSKPGKSSMQNQCKADCREGMPKALIMTSTQILFTEFAVCAPHHFGRALQFWHIMLHERISRVRLALPL